MMIRIMKVNRNNFKIILTATCLLFVSAVFAQNTKKPWVTLCNGTMTFMYGYKPSTPSIVSCPKCGKRTSYNNYCSNCGSSIKKDFVVYEVPMSVQTSDLDLDYSDKNTDALAKVISKIPWSRRMEGIRKVVFDPSFRQVTTITSTTCWFSSGKGDSQLTSISGLEYLNTSNVKYMGGMFAGCDKIKSVNVSHFQTSRVKEMWSMFAGCEKLTSLNLSKFDTRNVVSMAKMFSFCESLTSLNLSSFNTGNVWNMWGMFEYNENLTSLDLTHFNTRNTSVMIQMFEGCKKLTRLYVSSTGWDLRRAKANKKIEQYVLITPREDGVDDMFLLCPAKIIKR